MPRTYLSALLLGALAATASPARADFFVLSTGGRIEGQLLNPDESPRERYHIALASGGKTILGKYQVTRIIAKSEIEQRYDELLPKMPDTVEGHWIMADWCLRNKLNAQREFHLQSVVEREPEHAKARVALGYTNINGKWVLPEEHHKSMGLVKHQGAWLTPQEVELLARRERAEDAERRWRNDVNMWRAWLNRPSRAAEGAAQLAAIRDPLASPALVDLFESKKEPLANKLIYVEVLGRMVNESPLARGALVNQALYNTNADLRDKCLDRLEKGDRRAIGRMFVKALSDKSNKVVNRAAVGIARMNDASAIPDLIDALKTEHQFVVTTGNGNSNSLGASFGGPNGGLGGLSAGGSTKVVKDEVSNEEVHKALVLLTEGANHGFDKAAWKRWYAESKIPKEVDLRRRG